VRKRRKIALFVRIAIIAIVVLGPLALIEGTYRYYLTQIQMPDREDVTPQVELPAHLINALWVEARGKDEPKIVPDYSWNLCALLLGMGSERNSARSASGTLAYLAGKTLVFDAELNKRGNLHWQVGSTAAAMWFSRNANLHETVYFYLSHAYFGAGLRGLNMASRELFQKSPDSLDAAESALLVTILRQPSYFNPWCNPDNAKTYRDKLLVRMAESGFLANNELELALTVALPEASENKCQVTQEKKTL